MSSQYLAKQKSTKSFNSALKNNLLMAALMFFLWIHFIEPVVKVNGTYYRDNFLAKKLLSDMFRISQGGFCLPTGRCTGASSTRHRRFPGAKGARLHFSNDVVAEFTGSELSRL